MLPEATSTGTPNMDARFRSRPASFSRISCVLGELARTLRDQEHLQAELNGLDRRLDQALIYRAEPGANTGLAHAYLDRTLTRRAETVARLRANRAQARRLMSATDALIAPPAGPSPERPR